jgi:hypothetical protein
VWSVIVSAWGSVSCCERFGVGRGTQPAGAVINQSHPRVRCQLQQRPVVDAGLAVVFGGVAVPVQASLNQFHRFF